MILKTPSFNDYILRSNNWDDLDDLYYKDRFLMYNGRTYRLPLFSLNLEPCTFSFNSNAPILIRAGSNTITEKEFNEINQTWNLFYEKDSEN